LGFWHPERLQGSVNLVVADFPPMQWDLEAMIAMMKPLVGYDVYSYFHFFFDPAAPRILQDHVESFFTVLFAKDEAAFKALFTDHEAMRSFIEADKKQPVADWVTDDMRKSFIGYHQQHGFASPLNIYHVLKGTHYAHEKNFPIEKSHLDYPGLFVGALRDPVCLAMAVEGMKPLRKDLTIVNMDAHHWPMHEKPDELNQIMEKWLGEKF